MDELSPEEISAIGMFGYGSSVHLRAQQARQQKEAIKTMYSYNHLEEKPTLRQQIEACRDDVARALFIEKAGEKVIWEDMHDLYHKLFINCANVAIQAICERMGL